jgi:hypothetical protein
MFQGKFPGIHKTKGLDVEFSTLGPATFPEHDTASEDYA